MGKLFSTYAKSRILTGAPTFDEIRASSAGMDIGEFSKLLGDLELVPQLLSQEDMKKVFHEANVSPDSDDFRASINKVEFNWAATEILGRANAVVAGAGGEGGMKARAIPVGLQVLRSLDSGEQLPLNTLLVIQGKGKPADRTRKLGANNGVKVSPSNKLAIGKEPPSKRMYKQNQRIAGAAGSGKTTPRA